MQSDSVTLQSAGDMERRLLNMCGVEMLRCEFIRRRLNEEGIRLHSTALFFIPVDSACIPGIPVHRIEKLKMDGEGDEKAPEGITGRPLKLCYSARKCSKIFFTRICPLCKIG